MSVVVVMVAVVALALRCWCRSGWPWTRLALRRLGKRRKAAGVPRVHRGARACHWAGSGGCGRGGEEHARVARGPFIGEWIAPDVAGLGGRYHPCGNQRLRRQGRR